MYGTSFAGVDCETPPTIMRLWFGDAAPRMMLASHSWEICLVRSRELRFATYQLAQSPRKGERTMTLNGHDPVLGVESVILENLE